MSPGSGAAKLSTAARLHAAAQRHHALRAARLHTGDNVVPLRAVSRGGRITKKLEQTGCIHAGFQRLAHHAGRIVQAQIHAAQHVQRAADLPAHAGCGKAVGAKLHQIGPARDVAAVGAMPPPDF